MRVYIAGPMTGLPAKNFPAFFRAERILRARGFVPVNPARNEGEGLTWDEYMQVGIADLKTCDAIFLLPGWENSRGASIEVELARKSGLIFLTS